MWLSGLKLGPCSKSRCQAGAQAVNSKELHMAAWIQEDAQAITNGSGAPGHRGRWLFAIDASPRLLGVRGCRGLSVDPGDDQQNAHR